MKLTLEEKCRLVTGKGMWHNHDLEGKVQSIHLSDGPHGVRAALDGAHNNDSFEATCFPTASSVACSWDKDLIAQMADGIAKEAKDLGVSILLGPGINMKRSPLCGRNFEYLSEDPYLAGTMASSYVKAVQANGVGTSVKHFAGNNQETHRMTANSRIDERALREIYLAAFERVVKEAKPATIMASYNRLNNLHACENKHLLTEILRDEWGYEGLVMSDWAACAFLDACIEAGMDLEMPDSNGNHYLSLYDAIKEGRMDEKHLDCAVEKILKMVEDYQVEDASLLSDAKQVKRETRVANHRLARKVETESAVLLKNDGFLPIKRGTEVLVVGELAKKLRFQGGGSSHINTEHVSPLFKALSGVGLFPTYVQGYDVDDSKPDEDLEAEALIAVYEAEQKGMPILFFGGLTDKAEGEGYDRDSYRLPENQTSLLRQMLNISKNIGFVSFGGAPYAMNLVNKTRAVLQMYLGGEAVAGACALLLSGKANPCGKLAESFPYAIEDTPSYGYFGKQGDQRNHLDDVDYRESIFIGYRYYDTMKKRVLYPFGHGLSYTTFEYSDLKVRKSTAKNVSAKVSFNVTNTGTVAGKEIAQVYIKNPQEDILRPEKELRGYEKVFLNPGETKTIEISLDDRAFSVYADHTMNQEEEGFVTVAGKYEVLVGASSRDIRLSKEIEMSGAELCYKVSLEKQIPLTDSDFAKIYQYEIVDFSHIKPGDFTVKNSLTQLATACVEGKILLKLAKSACRIMMLPKPKTDPEVVMMMEGVTDGSLDSIVTFGTGAINIGMAEKLVEKANNSVSHKKG